MIWTAGFRSAVISPYEQIQLTEPRDFAGQTVRQALHMAGGGDREETGLATYSHKPMETAHIADGNHVASPVLPGAEQEEARFYVSGVDVFAPDDTAIAVAFGDSWFEGVGSTPPWTSSTGASTGDGSSTRASPETASCGTRSASTRWHASTATSSRYPA